MENQSVGLISLGGYLPAKDLKRDQATTPVNYLLKHTKLHESYITEIETTGQLPGGIETNYDGWKRTVV